jgi:hypothetical protein
LFVDRINRHRFKKRLTVKEKSRMEMEREMISILKREMEEPRLTTSVREALEAEAALAAKHPVARLAGA